MIVDRSLLYKMFATSKHNNKWWILGAMGCALGIILLDETMVGIALPTIQLDLGTTQVETHWIINGYLLLFACFIAVGGKLGDIIGLETVFFLGSTVFGLASIASGFAQNGLWIIAMHAIQGIGGAVVFPVSMAMLTVAFPQKQRGLALGIYSAVGTVFIIVGPLLGGFFTQFVSWRWIFWINPPLVGGIMLVVLASWKNQPLKDKRHSIDYLGLITLVLGLSGCVFAIMQGPIWGWLNPWTLSFFIGGSTILFLFVLIELQVLNPLIEVRLFQNGTFTASNLVVFMVQYSKMAVIIFGAFHFQKVFNMTPLMAGIALMPALVPIVIFVIPVGELADRFGSRWPSLIGLLVSVLSLLVMALAETVKSYDVFVPGLILWGIGASFLFAPPRKAVMDAVPLEKHGQASGIVLTAQMLGGVIGMAICSALLAMTGNYWVVFLVTSGITFAVLVISWFTLESPT